MPISTVVTSMKDEAPYIIEWVAYHRALGFDRVVVLANDCTDGTHEMLLRLHEIGAISYYENEVPVGAKPHSRALKIANTTPEVKTADFVMVLDADEFLVVKQAPHTLDVLLDVMDERSADMMVIPWRMFGSSHNMEFEDRPVIERFTQSMDASTLPKVGVKSLFRQADKLRLAIHFPKNVMKGGEPVGTPVEQVWIDAGGQTLTREVLTWNGGRQTIHRDLAEVAHFMIKSLDEYLLKIFRGDGLMNSSRHGIDYWRGADHNQVSDLVVADNVLGFEQERDRLFADPVLAELHRTSVAARFERLRTILANPDVQTLRGILKKSTSGTLEAEDIQISRALVTQMSPKIRTDNLIEGDIPHSTLLSVTDVGLADATGIAWRMFKQAREHSTMFWPEKKFAPRPITNLVEGLKRAQKNNREASLGARWFHNYLRTEPKEGWPLDEEILVVLTRDDDSILAGYPTYIAQTKDKHVQKSQRGMPPLHDVLTGAESAQDVEDLIAAGRMTDPRLRARRYLEDHPKAIVLNLDHPESVSAALHEIEGRGPSGPVAAKLLRGSLMMDLPDPEGNGSGPSSSQAPAPEQSETSSRGDAPSRRPLNNQVAESNGRTAEPDGAALKIGVLTLPMNRNYGGNLQAFALMQTLRNLGHRPVLLNRRHNSKTLPSSPEDLAQSSDIPLYVEDVGLGANVPNRLFLEKHTTPISRGFYSSEDLRHQIDSYEFDAVVVGSDQVWRPKYARNILNDFFLEFLNQSERPTKRISYAASFGSEKDEYSSAEKAVVEPLLKSFNAVSVREDSAVTLCRDMFGVEAHHVLDPTLLLSRDDYSGLLSEEQRAATGGHLLTYVLDATPDKQDVITRISTALSIEPRTANGLPFESVDPLKGKGGDKTVEGWLASFRNAAFVVTDSFHGVAFSIIFNKPFVAYGNAERGLARFKSLLKAVGLVDRIVISSDEVDLDHLLRPIDWPAVNGRLQGLRTQSLKFLTDALSFMPGGGDGTSEHKPEMASDRHVPSVQYSDQNESSAKDIGKPVAHAGADAPVAAETESLPMQAQEDIHPFAADARSLALHDSNRFSGAFLNGDAAGKLRAKLMFYAHALEKGLSHMEFRAGFGKAAMSNLAGYARVWLESGFDAEDPFFKAAISSAHVYFARHKDLGFDVSGHWKLFAPPVQVLIEAADGRFSGALEARLQREPVPEVDSNRSFLNVVYSRRSVREFVQTPVPLSKIKTAVQIASQAPSVCNRQGPRVHYFTDHGQIEKIVDLQSGFKGYAKPPGLLLVTCDLTCFVAPSERNQGFIDGGLFMMSLLLALEEVGLGSCPLNAAMNAGKEGKIRRIAGISASEILISFIAIGNFDPGVLVARSFRYPTSSILSVHDQAVEQTA
ncbi:polysaccharide pyruvyl transferase family protein [Paracoccus nototheniae]|uniref:Polysaccharide pyruvyl transferase family protein n=1 Tax=Paracoccus nototheniae TaxID=2489002 RepID=A0ABW4DYR7_9RHOB|nr:polysaccharide pyruvyl transferase family protein [Paracoccus nototheniae]